MASFNFDSKVGLETINSIVSDVVGQVQKSYQQADYPIFLIKNQVIINTAIDMAKDTVELHGIENDKVTNEKKFAHLCFWMLKLTPVSYVTKIPLMAMAGRVAGKFYSTSTPLGVDAEFEHVPVNTEVAYRVYITLYCTHKFNEHEAAHKAASIYDRQYSEEIMKSFRFHNYSARAMAMFLETIMMEKLA